MQSFTRIFLLVAAAVCALRGRAQPLVAQDTSGRAIDDIEDERAAQVIVQDLDEHAFVPFTVRRDTQLTIAGRFRASYQYEEQAGFQDSAYLGSRPSFYQRLDARWGAWSALGVMDKASGERATTDHLIASLACDSVLPGLSIIVGDYDVGLAQGLIFWRSMSPGKGGDVLRAPRRAAFGLVPARSPSDRAAFRGAAVTWTGAQVSASAFRADTRRDAALSDSNTFAALRTDGRYQTLADLAVRDAVRERADGVHVAFRAGDVTLGATGTAIRVDALWQHGDTAITQAYNAGIDWRVGFPGGEVFGECAADRFRNIAGVAGMSARVVPAIEMALLYRRFPERYFSMHTNAFGEHSSAENEEGLYCGVRWHVRPDIMVGMFHDVFTFPHPTSAVPLPSGGRESLVTIAAMLAPHVSVRLLYGEKRTPTAYDDVDQAGAPVRRMAQSWRRRERAEISFEHAGMRVRGRIECAQSFPTPLSPLRSGTLFMLDARAPIEHGIIAGGRLVWFATETYDGRVYANEDGLEGVASVPALSGTGNRSYIYVKVHSLAALSIELRWSALFMPGALTLGSGEEVIAGNARHVLEAQVSWKAAIK